MYIEIGEYRQITSPRQFVILNIQSYEEESSALDLTVETPQTDMTNCITSLIFTIAFTDNRQGRE